MSDNANQRIEAISVLRPQPGDVVFIKLGGDLGGGPPWIPSEEDLNDVSEELRGKLPEGVQVLVTHHLMDISVVRPD